MNLYRFALVDQVRRLPPADVEGLLSSLSVLEAAALADLWREFWARPDQIAPPGRWKHWLLCGGRGSGKTQTLSHWIIERARAGMGPIRLIAGTLADVRMTMVEGDSGILACSPADFVPRWDPSADDNAGRLEWPNGVVARGFSSERPKRLRGKQSRTDAYDDLAGMGPRAPEVVAMASYGLRVWGDTRAAYTTTPEDSPVVMRLLQGEIAGLVKTESITDDNIGNLAPDFISQIEAQFGGTELEQAERFGRLVERSKSSPFHGLDFNAAPIRIDSQPLEDLDAIAIGVDPADGAGPKSDEWGIAIVGKRHTDRHLVTLEDLSAVLPEDEAASLIIATAGRWRRACPNARIVICVEVNHGEAKVRALLDAAYYKLRAEALERGTELPPPLPEIVPIRAKDGKMLRAGEVRPLFAAGMFHHLPGLVALEAQALSLRPDAPKRPRQDDHVDAEVHAAHHLAALGGGGPAGPWEPVTPGPSRFGAADPRAPLSADPRRPLRRRDR
ncbi:MAG TPA: terminase family protein [Anaeromyxobacteraceae bacterium]|nr:terminase family protein [Anaeromyxobacteraceae bacterium]